MTDLASSRVSGHKYLGQITCPDQEGIQENAQMSIVMKPTDSYDVMFTWQMATKRYVFDMETDIQT